MSAPKKNQSSPAGLLVGLLLLLLVVIALVVVLRSCAANAVQPTASPAAPPAATETPAATEAPSPSPTAAPTPAPSPSPTPAPTPSPTAAPKIDASGSFRSDTGTGLELAADWTASYGGDGKADVTVTLYAVSYSLQCRDIWNGASVTVNGETRSFSTPAIDCKGPGQERTALGSAVFSVPLTDGKLSVSAQAAWAFRGTYGGTELPSLTAEGTIAG